MSNISVKEESGLAVISGFQSQVEALQLCAADNHDIRDFSARVLANQVQEVEDSTGPGKPSTVMLAGRAGFSTIGKHLRFVRAQPLRTAPFGSSFDGS
jgi:hypothetical protein